MLIQKLDADDLQHEKMKSFDGTMVYAQQKRQQVIMTAEYARMYQKIHFSSMHPGWADTPGKFWCVWDSGVRDGGRGGDSGVCHPWFISLPGIYCGHPWIM